VKRPDDLKLALAACLLGILCFPFALAGGGWAVLTLMAARNEKRPPRRLARVCVAVSLLATAVNVSVAMIGVEANSERKRQVAAIAAKLEGRIDSETLDAEAACDLARQHLITRSAYQSISCLPGYQPGAVPRLEVDTEKRGQRSHFTFCFARGQRWQVLDTAVDGGCPHGAPP
jgi:hypothetical protein